MDSRIQRMGKNRINYRNPNYCHLRRRVVQFFKNKRNIKNLRMKKIVIFLGFLGLSLLSNSQIIKSVVPIIAQGAEYIKLIEEKYKQQIVNIEYDAVLDKKFIYRELYANVIYGIIVYGDNNVKDLNLSIYSIVDEDWKEVAKDDQTESMAMIYYTPTTDGLYRFEISAEVFDKNTFGYYGVIIYR